MKKRIKPAVLILGKLPPPYFGPAVATRILLNSRLNRRYTLHHLDTGLNRSTATINRFRVRSASPLPDSSRIHSSFF